MISKMVSGGLKAVVWGLAATGFGALVLAGLVAWPVRQPPELTSISGARKSVDLSSLPAIERFQARDGTALGFRHYSATGRAAILIHGSSRSSGTTIISGADNELMLADKYVEAVRGMAVSALTLIGYFFVGDAFDLWMAFVNGGGLVLGGLWMRRS